MENVRFRDVSRLADALGFRLDRVRGSHHVFVHPRLGIILNLQEVDGQVKPYQLRQLLALIERYPLVLER